MRKTLIQTTSLSMDQTLQKNDFKSEHEKRVKTTNELGIPIVEKMETKHILPMVIPKEIS